MRNILLLLAVKTISKKLYLFFKIGVNRGSKSLIGGCILFIPITFTMA